MPLSLTSSIALTKKSARKLPHGPEMNAESPVSQTAGNLSRRIDFALREGFAHLMRHGQATKAKESWSADDVFLQAVHYEESPTAMFEGGEEREEGFFVTSINTRLQADCFKAIRRHHPDHHHPHHCYGDWMG